MAMSSHDRCVIETPLRPNSIQMERNKTFFFSGGICGSGRYNAVPPNCKHYKQQRYSGGVRQTVGRNMHSEEMPCHHSLVQSINLLIKFNIFNVHPYKGV